MISTRTFKIFTAFIAFTAVTACKKDPIQYTFEGAVTESVNHAALNDVYVKISQRIYNGSVASAYYNTAGTYTTGSDGRYEIIFAREKVFEFKAEMTKAGYFGFEKVISSADVSTDENEVINTTLEPISWITFHLENFAGLTEDELAMIHFNFRTGCTGCTTNSYYYYNGIVDTTFTIKTTGGIYTRYSYKNPDATYFINDSVYATPFDTAFVEIIY